MADYLDMRVFLSLLATVYFSADAFPTGAPENACANLYPSSHGKSTATGTAPFNIMFSSSTYQANQVLQVTLSGIGSAQFKGYLIEGRLQGSKATDPIGTFQNLSSTAKVLCDYGSAGNGVTHTDNSVKSSVTFQWQAPAKLTGNIVFHYTVVRGGAPSTDSNPADYFMDVQSVALVPQSSGFRPLLFKPEGGESIIPSGKARMEIDVEEILEEEHVE